jgi:DNA-binding sugar fermentation-stimulating protein
MSRQTRQLRNQDRESPSKLAMGRLNDSGSVERVYTPQYEIQIKRVVDQKKRNKEAQDLLAQTLQSLLVCDAIAKQIANEAVVESEFMQSVKKQEPEFIVGHTLVSTVMYLNLV